MSYRCYKEDNHKCSEPVMAPEGRILIYLKRHDVKELSSKQLSLIKFKVNYLTLSNRKYGATKIML